MDARSAGKVEQAGGMIYARCGIDGRLYIRRLVVIANPWGQAPRESKNVLKTISQAMNLPDSWQTYWQSRAAIAADPKNLSAHLKRRDEALRTFVDDFRRYEDRLPADFVRRMEAWLSDRTNPQNNTMED